MERSWRHHHDMLIERFPAPSGELRVSLDVMLFRPPPFLRPVDGPVADAMRFPGLYNCSFRAARRPRRAEHFALNAAGLRLGASNFFLAAAKLCVAAGGPLPERCARLAQLTPPHPRVMHPHAPHPGCSARLCCTRTSPSCLSGCVP